MVYKPTTWSKVPHLFPENPRNCGLFLMNSMRPLALSSWFSVCLFWFAGSVDVLNRSDENKYGEKSWEIMRQKDREWKAPDSCWSSLLSHGQVTRRSLDPARKVWVCVKSWQLLLYLCAYIKCHILFWTCAFSSSVLVLSMCVSEWGLVL